MKTLFSTRARCLSLLVLASTLSSCTPVSEAQVSPPANAAERRIAKHTVVKKVCMDEVNYYATEITDAINSISGRTYLVIGGAVYVKGSSTPESC